MQEAAQQQTAAKRSAPSAPAGAVPVTASRVPRWARFIFSTFPIYEWPAAQVTDSNYEPPPEMPVLYIAPGHPIPVQARNQRIVDEKGVDSAPPAGRSWASADPQCLRWQMELLFRRFDFVTRQVDEVDSWGPGPHAPMPYLRLPSSYQIGAPAQSSVTLRALVSLIGSKDLARWTENHAPWWKERPELQENGTTTSDSASDPQAAEAQTWISLLSTKVMAGVVSAPHAVRT